MTAPALIKKSDLTNAAKVANETGCAIEIKVGATVYIIRPGSQKPVDEKAPIRL